MGQIVANVPEDATAKHLHGGEPVVKEDCMGELPERGRENDEQGWWHNQSISVHREVVMDAVEKEMKRQADSVIRKPSGYVLASNNSL